MAKQIKLSFIFLSALLRLVSTMEQDLSLSCFHWWKDREGQKSNLIYSYSIFLLNSSYRLQLISESSLIKKIDPLHWTITTQHLCFIVYYSIINIQSYNLWNTWNTFLKLSISHCPQRQVDRFDITLIPFCSIYLGAWFTSCEVIWQILIVYLPLVIAVTGAGLYGSVAGCQAWVSSAYN